MGTIVITEFVSLDGVMQGPGGAEAGFPHAGWTFTFNRGEDGDAFKFQESANTAALLLGRVTYEGFAAAWPAVTGEFADMFNALPKYVVSSTLTDPDWGDTTVIGGDFVTEMAALKDRIDGEIVVHGSRRLAQGLIAHDLADEIRLMVFPIVVGSGHRLFAEAPDTKRFTLAGTAVFGEGVVLLTLHRAG